MKRRLLVATTTALVVLLTQLGDAYSTLGPRWPGGNIVMHLQLGSSASLIDGSAGWNQVSEQALALWNESAAGLAFRVQSDSTQSVLFRNDINNVAWARDIYGESFDDAVAVTVWRYRLSDNVLLESDVLFNSNRDWNSYRGRLRTTSGGRRLFDIRRVALHEFGHVLGLDHPDEFGQSVAAVMNSRVSDTDSLQADDIAGARAIYGNHSPTPPSPPPVVIVFPPRNESFEFRVALEGKYRDGLRRSAQGTFVDIEGSVVWVQEYLRYRLSQCSDADATNRVFLQIEGRGIQPTCGTMTSTFPPRDHTLNFRRNLESQYRDVLRQNASSTAVDIEGDVIWIAEYLRYRVSGCSHPLAQSKVFEQIDGRGVLAACGA